MTYFAAFILIAMIAGIAALLERNDRRTAGQPTVPFGSELDRDVDLGRVRHDLDVARSSGNGRRRAAGMHHGHPMRLA